MMLAPLGVAAQENESAALSFLNQIRDARTAGTAGIVSSAKAGGNAHFGNVADAGFYDGTFTGGVSYILWQPSVTESNIVSANGVYSINEKWAVTAGVSSSVYKSDKGFDEYGVAVSSVRPADLVAGAGVAYKFTDFLSAGVALNYVMSKTVAGTTNAFAGDVQLAFRKDGWNASLAVCNLGPKVKSDSGEKWNLPMNARLNAGYSYSFGKSLIYGALQGRYFFCEPTAFSGGVMAEYIWNDLIACRAGFNAGSKKNGLPTYGSLGASLTLKGFSIDISYSVAPSTAMKNTFACGVGYSF